MFFILHPDSETMESVNCIPIISEIKSTGQASGDLKEARKTQQDFISQNDMSHVSLFATAWMTLKEKAQ